MNKNNRRILIVAAHPDDEVLGCGATTAKHVRGGDTVWTLILGEGITSRQELTSSKKQRPLKELKDNAQKSNAILGVEKLVMRSFPDNAFDSVPRIKIVHAIENIIKQLRPNLIYTHSSTDLNVDHQITSESVKTACRPLPGATTTEILSFEVPSSTEWRFDVSHSFHANVFVNVSKFIELKIQALKVYRGEIRHFPHPRSAEYLRALAAVRGGQVGLEAAEAFSLVRRVQP